jgi:hypothetical protein
MPLCPPLIPCWDDLPPKHREELLRILGRMLTEQIDHALATAGKGVTHEPH